ncbi:YokU family protein [Aneurinibacillus terranovensis]|uniref:YokU family protein n=1 Tax=Aneurinibacillus terranovensis TaxID=278991 RepID=UPI0004197B38|nr:YokU family protein [Aneurinibacillus terranovensis]
MVECIWCGKEANEGVKNCYWITPDGKKTVEILSIPAIICPHCEPYVSDEITQKIEEALYLNDIAALGLKFSL